MPDLRVLDSCELRGIKNLEVEVEGNPGALIFKGAHREALRAIVCGECGNAELSAENPKALWKTYTEQKNS